MLRIPIVSSPIRSQPPIALLRNTGQPRHGLPLPARVRRINRYEHSGKPARFAGIHENSCRRPHEIGRRRSSIDQKKPACKIRRFQSHLIVEDAQPTRRYRRCAVAPRNDEIGRKLLGLRRDATEQQNADENNEGHP
ncbi:MAG: hypothetical protein KGL35_13375 [Bradyrhizobium sp.]|nr:hypothetical protein [Bradyrhizobium sp.]